MLIVLAILALLVLPSAVGIARDWRFDRQIRAARGYVPVVPRV